VLNVVGLVVWRCKLLSDAKAKDLKKSLATDAFNVGREAEQTNCQMDGNSLSILNLIVLLS